MEMSTKPVDVRVEECVRLRKQWTEVIPRPLPEEIVRAMNAFVRDGRGSSGSTHCFDRKVEYQFATLQGRDTFLLIKSP